MFSNRIRSLYRLAAQFLPVNTNQSAFTLPPGFAILPISVAAAPVGWQNDLYRAAYEQARRTVVPRYLRRLAVWN